ncbi:DUF4123 domain-containing protein [Pseudomonas sp. UFMG81]|uniref:DUF4123 domain-containing protein n=1 Tax=Pseudomonas sp. UFMG81 TaxID=2745936 RepID=UPI00189008D8|nr:DUF4123 domain-containing protein [Pseudomonas sp. UFMG81]
MSTITPWQWITQQRALGRDIALVLDAQVEARQALMGSLPPDRRQVLYQQTDAAYLALHGPACFLVGEAEVRLIQPLLELPDDHWGWLASLAPGDLPAWVEHWRARLLVGEPPQRALYRFHDNRVLARGLAAARASLPAYLGQAISVCYWQGQAWATLDNPAPGPHPLPAAPAWLQLPVPNVTGQVARANAHRYLYSHHLAAYLALAERQPPRAWLQRQLQRAQDWGWLAPVQIECLLVLSLGAPGFELPRHCAPLPGELPQAHVDRLRRHTVI